MSKGTVFVGMSGGVDSSVSALLLKKQGYTVVGVFIKVWHPDFLACHWEQERLDAMRVAAHLEIPFLTCNAEQAYKDNVAQYFIEEYRNGRTPNPDVMCNTHIKFGNFFDFARAHGADHIATGHYARTENREGRSALLRGIDTAKDQSYFLWNISDDAFSHTLFPIGHLEKSHVRRIAQNAHLPTARKDDSQGICFLGHVDMFSFLSHYIDLKEGEVRTEEGVVIGTHKGSELYTLGQRHGFTIYPNHTHTTPYFVCSKDIVKNVLTVSHVKTTPVAESSHILLSHTRWFRGLPVVGMTLMYQTRYRQTPLQGTVLTCSETEAELVPDEVSEEFPTPGQSCVLYDGAYVVGGGIIETSIK